MNKGKATKSHLLELAKEEFLDKGYSEASVRNIAKSAGLTTGAVFRYFPDKESIFAELVAPVASEVQAMYRKGSERGVYYLHGSRTQDMWGISDEVIISMVDYIFANKDVFTLLINCAAGSAHEHFVDELIADEERQSIAHLREMQTRGIPCADVTEQDIHVLLSAQYYAFFEIVRHDTPKDEALKRVRVISDFFRSGWKQIYGG